MNTNNSNINPSSKNLFTLNSLNCTDENERPVAPIYCISADLPGFGSQELYAGSLEHLAALRDEIDRFLGGVKL